MNVTHEENMKQIEIFATNLKNNIDDFTIDEIINKVRSFNLIMFPNPNSLTLDEYNFIANYAIEARKVLAKKKLNKTTIKPL